MNAACISDALANVTKTLRARRFLIGSERTVQEEIERALTDADLTFERELRLDPHNRIDFLVGSIGIELKVKGSRRAILRQVERYCAFEAISGLVLLTGVAMGLPPKIAGKPIEIVSLGEAWL